MVAPKIAPAGPRPLKPWIMACFVVVLGALALYFYLQAQSLGLKSNTSITPPTGSTTPPSPLTYMDPVNNITFEYPGNWLLRRPVDGNGPNPCCNISFTDGDDTLLRVTIFENEYESFVQKISMLPSSKPEPVTEYAFPGVLLKNDLGGEYILNVQGRTLDFQYSVISQERNKEMVDSLHHILSTLKFTTL